MTNQTNHTITDDNEDEDARVFLKRQSVWKLEFLVNLIEETEDRINELKAKKKDRQDRNELRRKERALVKYNKWADGHRWTLRLFGDV